MSDQYLGIDIGGTKMAAGLVSATGDLITAERRPTPVTPDPDQLFGALGDLIDRVGGRPWSAIGVGCGGPMRYPVGAVSPLNIPAWRDFPLRDRLAARYACPVVVDNDAKAFALGETRFGAGRGRANVLGLVVSTGVGGGLILDGRLIHGGTGNAGHFGHLVVRPMGPRCGCGARGCIEAIAAGPSIARRYRARVGADAAGATGESVAAAARSGDRLAQALIDESATAVGRGIGLVANLADLDRVVIGGGVAQIGESYLAVVRAATLAWTGFPFARRVEIGPAALGRESGVVGAAALVIPER